MYRVNSEDMHDLILQVVGDFEDNGVHLSTNRFETLRDISGLRRCVCCLFFSNWAP